MTDCVENHLDEQIDPAEGRVSWRDHLPVHPAAEYFPQLPHDELTVLGEDIRKNGLQSPIVVLCEKINGDCRFSLLDGRNRLDAMAAVGINFKIRRRRDDYQFPDLEFDDDDIPSSLMDEGQGTVTG